MESGLGFAALPYSCRQFPRVLLADRRGWHLSLSSWCGTAARLIARAGRDGFLSFAHIEADPRVHVEALDAREAWPPFLRPGVLAGHAAYAAWEERLIADVLAPVAAGSLELGDALTAALRWTDLMRGWRPADGELTVMIGRSRLPHRHAGVHLGMRHGSTACANLAHVFSDLMSRVPRQWQAPGWPDGLVDASFEGEVLDRASAEAALARYLAVRLTASWVAYQGHGLRSVAASLVSSVALATLAMSKTRGAPTIGRLTSAIRAADWLQLHLLDRDVWAQWCSRFEGERDGTVLVSLVADVAQVLDGLPWAPSSSPHSAAGGQHSLGPQ